MRGLQELQRGFRAADKELSRELRTGLSKAAEPVKEDAEQFAATRIRNIGPDWSRMRVGVTQRVVYVAPKERGRRSRRILSIRRENLKILLLDRAMDPALDANTGNIERAMETVLGSVGKAWEKA